MWDPLPLLRVHGYKEWGLRIALDLLLMSWSHSPTNAYELMLPLRPSPEPAPGNLDIHSSKFTQRSLFSAWSFPATCIYFYFSIQTENVPTQPRSGVIRLVSCPLKGLSRQWFQVIKNYPVADNQNGVVTVSRSDFLTMTATTFRHRVSLFWDAVWVTLFSYLGAVGERNEAVGLILLQHRPFDRSWTKATRSLSNTDTLIIFSASIQSLCNNK